jgi:hypothetical protein
MNIALATVRSSHGVFTINAETGHVIEFSKFHPDDPEGEIYRQITCFDLLEYRDYYPNEQHPATDYDILDLGYWYGHNHAYEPPVLDWRQDCAYERANCHSLAVPSSVAELINPTTGA